LIFCPPIVLGISEMVFFSGMPSEAAGPVAEMVTPTLTSAHAARAVVHRAAISRGLKNFMVGLSPG
jgi:hypothetical protein